MTKKKAVIDNYRKKQLMAVLALLFLIPALWITGIWIEVWNSHRQLTPTARIKHFLDHFPGFMNTTVYIVVINLLCSVAALILASKSFKQRSVLLRVLTIITAMIASLIIILTLFMML